MSNNQQGRGRGRGGGRGQHRRDQPPSPSFGRGSAVGRDSPQPSEFPPLGSPSAITHDFQQKLKVAQPGASGQAAQPRAQGAYARGPAPMGQVAQPRGPAPTGQVGLPRGPASSGQVALSWVPVPSGNVAQERAPAPYGQVAQARAPAPGQVMQARGPAPTGQVAQARASAPTGQVAQPRAPGPSGQVAQAGTVIQAQPTGQVAQARPPTGQVAQARAPAQTQQTGQVVPPTRAPSSSKAITLPARPGYGTLGRKCTVKANHFLVKVADKELYHYDVTITPEVTSKKVCRLIMQELSNCYCKSHLGKRQIAYDGVKSMYTAGELPFSSKDFVIKIDKDDNSRRDREFKVAIKFAAKPDLHHLQEFLLGRQLDSPQETIQVLDVVLRSKPSIKYTVVGRSFFDKDLGGMGSLTEGLEYWKGFYQSLRPTQMGLSLNIDVSARAFYESILVTEFASRYCNIRNLTRPLSDQDRIRLKKALRGIAVVLVTNEGGRRYKVNGFTPQPLSKLTFVNDTGAKTSVIQYFHEKYNAILRLTALPAVQAGNDSKPVYLPMELCKIVSGQRYTKKLSERQVTALLRATCQRPSVREESIKQMVKHNDYSKDHVVDDFGIQVNCELTSVEARVLPPPQLQYLGAQENPRVGSWNMIKKKMVNGARIDFWTCVNFSKLEPEGVERFCGALVKMCHEKGIVFHQRPIIPYQTAHPSQIGATLSNIHTKSIEQIASVGHAGKQLQLLIIILPDIKGSYGNIKLICETELGIVSQCCQPKQAYNCNGQYLENLTLKINVKAGGRNTVLVNAIQKRIPKITDVPTIIFGADVTHPSPGEDSSPSIAAVVASMDWPEVTKYRAVVSAQQHRDEIIHDLYTCTQTAKGPESHAGMIRELLIAFLRSTHFKPQRIIFYRDGVSEGQFSQVLLYEMDAIRKACLSLEEGYLPPVTFLVVQKRHHTRLFAENHNDRSAVDKSGNILPGTVIDTSICHPTEFDWYLNSHAGIQGTSRPAHYHVLFDENNFSADELQSLTNNLCYTYARCTRSVSIVPAAYYAHLAAFRARYYMEGNATSDSESAGGSNTRERAVDVRAVPKIKDCVKEFMFYC